MEKKGTKLDQRTCQANKTREFPLPHIIYGFQHRTIFLGFFYPMIVEVSLLGREGFQRIWDLTSVATPSQLKRQ
jgi:hypothetical protein